MPISGPSPPMRMRGNSSAWIRGRLAASLLFLALPTAARGADWYVSDAAGIAFAAVARSRALRLDYALSVEVPDAASVPPSSLEYLAGGGRVEIRTLWAGGKEKWRSLSAWDREKVLRFEERTDDGGLVSRDRYDAEGRLSESSKLASDGTGTVTRYRFERSLLISADSFAVVLPEAGVLEEQPSWTESYRYNRDGALISVARIAAEGGEGSSARFVSRLGAPVLLETRAPDGYAVRTRFDALGRPTENSSIDAEGAVIGAVESTTYEADAEKGGPAVKRRTEGEVSVETRLDDKGRIVSETRNGKDGTLVEETTNVWKDERLIVVERETLSATRRTEYEYDGAGDRVAERDYRDGILERSRRKDGDVEVEELYVEGKAVLRAIWVGGVKTKEERVREKAR